MAYERIVPEGHDSGRHGNGVLTGPPRFAKWLQIAGSIGVIGFLAYRLTEIGWAEVGRSLPQTVWFYVLFAGQYLAIPATELVIYRRVWHRRDGANMPVLLRKRVLNFGVLGYLGEAYFALWVRQTLGAVKPPALSTVKDVDVLSAIASNVATIVLVIAFLLTGQLQAFVASTPGFLKYFSIFAGIVAIAIVGVIVFRRRILSLETRTLAFVAACHAIRLIVIFALQVGQWAVVLPMVPMTTWLVFLTAQMVMTRIPFLPSQDLMVLGLGVALSSVVDVPAIAVAGMFVAAGALSQIANLVIFGWTSVAGYRTAAP